ncbi:hypothetical protein Dimus_006252 [Dionaea muscipula]
MMVYWYDNVTCDNYSKVEERAGAREEQGKEGLLASAEPGSSVITTHKSETGALLIRQQQHQLFQPLSLHDHMLLPSDELQPANFLLLHDMKKAAKKRESWVREGKINDQRLKREESFFCWVGDFYGFFLGGMGLRGGIYGVGRINKKRGRKKIKNWTEEQESR